MLILLWFYAAHPFFYRFKHVIWLWYMLSLQYVYEHLKWRLYEFWKFNMFWETFGLIACTISILNIGFIKVFEFKKYFWTLEHGNISRFKSVWQFFHSQNSFQIHVFSKSNFILHDKLVFEIVEYFNEGQCNEIKLSAFIYNNLSWQQNKICWCTYIKNFLTFQESKKAFSFIDVRTNLNILIRDLLKNWYSAYKNTKCPFKLPKFMQPPLDHYNVKVYILKSDWNITL